MDQQALAQLLGNYGEFFGGIVVVVSVVYLALQLKTANVQAQASAQIAWTQGLNEIWDRWGKPEARDALRRGFSDFKSLSNDDQVVFQMQVGSLVNHLLVAQGLAQQGLLPSSFVKTADDMLVQVLGTSGGLQYWEADAKATPGGEALLQEVRNRASEVQHWDDIFPWWKNTE
jgi:hypothetical protein